MIRRYLWYVLRHKWFVLMACCRLGIPWAGVVHDLSKFRPSEFMPYARRFYGPEYHSIKDVHGDARNVALDTGMYVERVSQDFDRAWLLHQHRNPHHWQFWVLREDSGTTKLLPMPDRYRREMLADWTGAGLALGKPNIVGWYMKNRERIQLAPETRAWVEEELGLILAPVNGATDAAD